MTARHGAMPTLCLFCSFNANQLLSRSARRALPSSGARSFSATSVAWRAEGHKKINKLRFAGARQASEARLKYETLLQRDVPAPYRSRENQVEPRAKPNRLKNTHELENYVEQAIVNVTPTQHMYRGSLAGLVRKQMISYEELRAQWDGFCADVLQSFHSKDLAPSRPDIPSLRHLEATYRKGGVENLGKVLQLAFMSHAGYKKRPASLVKHLNMEAAADTRFPQEWYVGTRQTQRTWHLHVGPTNSGKTYQALKRLEESRNGIYAGPLRLLAQEIFERMNAKGIPCNLVMGDDVQVVDEYANVTSSTMEMVNLSKEVDVCVIDEIQMIGDEERGWAWTEAVLGVKAKEVHMCGEERTVDLIRRLAASVGDRLIIHRYTRLGPLEVEDESLDGDVTKVQKGDCVVTFSRRNIFAMKRNIEEKTGKRCAVIYGSLPPETRSMQARLFNDENSDYDVLVASDAVGMGLNLSIKRVIFEAVEKWNGERTVAIPIPSIKQISGRAGRYKVPGRKDEVKLDETSTPLPPAPQVGYVTTLDRSDLKAVRKALATDVKPLKTAGVLPLSHHIEVFAAQFPPEVAFSKIIRELEQYVRTSDLFHSCSLKEHIEISQLFDDIKGLTVADRMVFIMAPIGRDPRTKLAVQRMAECVANNSNGSILRIEEMDLEALDTNPKTIIDLQRLEVLHKSLIVYLWLSYRFPATFHPRETAKELKVLCEEKIEMGLKAVRFTRKKATRRIAAANDIVKPLDDHPMANLKEGKIEPDQYVPGISASAEAIFDEATPSHADSLRV